MSSPHEFPGAAARTAAVIAGPAGPGDLHAETVLALARHGVPGYRTELIASDEAPERVAAGAYEVVHLLSCDHAALATAIQARAAGSAVFATHGPAPRGPRGRTAGQREALYGRCDYVISPTRGADAQLAVLGVRAGQMARWQPGVDGECFGPARYTARALPPHPEGIADPLTVLAAGPFGRFGEALLARALLRARLAEPRLSLVIIGDTQLAGPGMTPVGDLPRDAAAALFASAELLIDATPGERFGRAVLQAQASGLPVLALAGSAGAELIEPGRSGCVVDADPAQLADAILGLSRRAALRERLSTGGLATARARTWPRALAALGVCWDRALPQPLADPAAPLEVVRAA